ncbi:MAG: putative 3-hydroxyacyl-CoA dehydrogenase [Fibrobacteres bacterium]|nr:putative 3-hydroxyacyl-CoA dehydrogenase [Fibrobacterota bacterium]
MGAAEGGDALMKERLRSVAVLGAGGKMGSGIAWVALKAMAEQDARENGVPGSGKFALALIDADPAAFPRLRAYLKSQLLKTAEKAIGDLRTWAKDRADLIENADIIDAYVDGAMSLARCETDAAGAKSAKLVFEAVFEDLGLKKELYARLKSLCAPDTVFLTNTSSIPISILDQSAGLDGRLLGFHFYNPPAVQKLVEMISGKRTRPEVTALGRELGKAFGKLTVPSNDVAGFIGNGHFVRELLFAFRKFRELRPIHGDAEALLLLNKTTQDFLIRPMGVFQLLDYVGVDVFQMILKVMKTHLDPASADGTVFSDQTLDALLAAGVRGGQLGSGEQKDGLFRYERNKITAVLDVAGLNAGKGIPYVSLGDEARFRKPLESLGALPEGHVPWTVLAKDPGKKEKLTGYLANLAKAETPGARLGREFLDHSRKVGRTLVGTGVAAGDEDVAKVLMNGFFHLYGPADWTH